MVYGPGWRVFGFSSAGAVEIRDAFLAPGRPDGRTASHAYPTYRRSVPLRAFLIGIPRHSKESPMTAAA